MKKKQTTYIILAIMLLLVLTIGLSYAFTGAMIKGQDTNIAGQSNDRFVVTTKDIFDIPLSNKKIQLETNGYINTNDILLVKDEDRDIYSEKGYFRVINLDYNDELIYEIYFYDLVVSENLQNENFKWELVDLETKTPIINGNFNQINEESLLLLDNIVIPPRTAQEYELRIWLSETEEDQSNLLNGNFSAKVYINGKVNY